MIRLLYALVLAAAAAVPAGAGPFYVGETVVVEPLEFTVAGLRYSQGKRFDKPGTGNLFLLCDLELRNRGPAAEPVRLRRMARVLALGDTVVFDTLRNAAARKVTELAPGAEAGVTVKFVVPRSAYDEGALLLLSRGPVRAQVDLRYVNAFDGHLAAGIGLADRDEYGDAMREFRAALGSADAKKGDDRCYVLYRIGELYTRMFLYEDAVAEFERVVQACRGGDTAAEAAGHVAALQERIDAESPAARASRLVECGYAYAFQLGDHEKALALFDGIRKGYAHHAIGEFTAGQVADLYAINVLMNLGRFGDADGLCNGALEGAQGAFADQLRKLREQLDTLEKKGK